MSYKLSTDAADVKAWRDDTASHVTVWIDEHEDDDHEANAASITLPVDQAHKLAVILSVLASGGDS